TALAIDVLRATSAAVAACEAGCRRVVAVPDAAAAEALAARDGADTVRAGERGGEPLAGFDLGNSPAEFTAAAVARRTVVLTTTNGTAAMLAASRAAAAGLAALTNLSAAARWAREEGRDVSILCAGDSGALSLEDVVCAGLLVARLSEPGAAVLSDGAATALALGRYYGARLDRLAEASPWARRLARHDRGADLAACLRIDASDVVPVFAEGGFVPRRVPAAGRVAAAARPEGGS
ncbi:MAG TPA: 2-phosphosulfolactate phosphatase, partial [Methylomirabilota bacterium]|nr:2-phosphosulfolactate phosphatase [Methylomirabilota bacterium]